MKMRNLLSRADTSNDGIVEREEWREALQKDSVRTWLSAMDIEVGDPDLLFDFLDCGGDGRLTLQELIDGISRLRGAARSIDVISMSHRIMNLEDILDGIARKLDKVSRTQRSQRFSR